MTAVRSGLRLSRLVKPATKRRRRQRRAVPVAIAGKWCQVEGEDSATAADRACRGLVRLSGCWQSAVAAGVARAGSARSAVRSGLRLSIGEAGHEATTAPGSSGAGGDRRQVGQGEGETAHRLPIGRAVAWSGYRACSQASVADVRQGCLWRGPCWQCSITGSSVRVFVLSIGEAGHEATTAPASSGAGGDRRQVGQGEGETAYRLPIGVAVAWSGVGLLAGSGCRREDGIGRQPVGPPSMTGSSVRVLRLLDW
jgi:hypothetical protein